MPGEAKELIEEKYNIIFSGIVATLPKMIILGRWAMPKLLKYELNSKRGSNNPWQPFKYLKKRSERVIVLAPPNHKNTLYRERTSIHLMLCLNKYQIIKSLWGR